MFDLLFTMWKAKVTLLSKATDSEFLTQGSHLPGEQLGVWVSCSGTLQHGTRSSQDSNPLYSTPPGGC